MVSALPDERVNRVPPISSFIRANKENRSPNLRRIIPDESGEDSDRDFHHANKVVHARRLYELQPELEIHSYNYPFITARIPFVNYESSTFARIQSRLRRIPGLKARYSPRKILSPVIPIILPGVDYSAESLVNSLALENEGLPDKSKLGWQHLDAFADYCLGIMALGRETYASLIDAWYYGSDSDSYFQALEVLAEEMLHHISDEIAGPRYTERAVSREHYWMKSYGEFPERLDIVLLRLRDEYLGRLERSIKQNRVESAGSSVVPSQVLPQEP